VERNEKYSDSMWREMKSIVSVRRNEKYSDSVERNEKYSECEEK
jgi:hypothetical protein